jgi:hypothetical protein
VLVIAGVKVTVPEKSQLPSNFTGFAGSGFAGSGFAGSGVGAGFAACFLVC